MVTSGRQDSKLECEMMAGMFRAGDMVPLGIKVMGRDTSMGMEEDTQVITVSLFTTDTHIFQKMPRRGLGCIPDPLPSSPLPKAPLPQAHNDLLYTIPKHN